LTASKFFHVSPIAQGVTRITGLGGEHCYLVEGAERALLIDTLTGAGNLKAFVRELTDLPVVVVNTHGHLDHCGGNFEYGECYIHPDDARLIYEHGSVEVRKGFVDSMRHALLNPPAVTIEDFMPPVAIKTYPVYDGDIFDLGGRQLEVIGVPGHSAGTIVLLDRELRAVFSGDACNANTLLCIDHSTSIEEYLDSLHHLQSYSSAYDAFYGGHGVGPVPAVIVDEAILLCHEIMEDRDDQIKSVYSSMHCYYAKAKGEHFNRLDGKIANIAYIKEKITRSAPVKRVVGKPLVEEKMEF